MSICVMCGVRDAVNKFHCKDCIELYKEYNEERQTFTKDLNLNDPETFRNNPATCKVFLHTYFKLFPFQTKH